MNGIDDEALTIVRRYPDRIRVELKPDKVISERLISTIRGAIEKTDFNGQIVEVRRIKTGGRYEHYIRVSIGSPICYISEMGAPIVAEMILNNETMKNIKKVATKFNIRNTLYRTRRIKLAIVREMYEELTSDMIEDLKLMTEKQLCEFWLKNINPDERYLYKKFFGDDQ